MTRKKCRRKVWALIDPIAHAIAGAAITDTASLNKLRMAELSAIEAFAKGRATPHDWRAIADMLNVSESLCSMGVGPEALETCLKAQEALGNVHARHSQGKPLLFTGPELQTVRDAYEYADLQRASVSRSQLETAVKKTADRIRSAHPDLKVYA
jgi:hypothetical protein